MDERLPVKKKFKRNYSLFVMINIFIEIQPLFGPFLESSVKNFTADSQWHTLLKSAPFVLCGRKFGQFTRVGQVVPTLFTIIRPQLAKKFLPLEKIRPLCWIWHFFLFYQNDVKFLNHYSVKFYAYCSFNAFICKEYWTKSFFLIRPLFGPFWDNLAQIWPRIC